MTPEEIAEYEALINSIPKKPYEERVADRIREKYSEADEFGILRQRYTKPEEFNEYFSFVEQVKAEEKII
jgi:hypothetical protein